MAGEWLHGTIEYVGRASIPGLATKSIIDMMFGVASLAASKPAIDALARAGYCYYPYKADVMHWFCKPKPEYRTHHLHLIPYASKLWKQRLKFRDNLHENDDVAQKSQV